MRAELDVREPGGRSRRLLVDRVLVLGRDGADVELADPAVSRRHCSLTPGGDGTVEIEDLESTHGTSVNGRRIHARTRVGPGDRVVIGDTVLTILGRTGPGSPVPPPPLKEVEDRRVAVTAEPGTRAAEAVPDVRAAADRVWPRLVRLLPDPDRVHPVIHLVDPFPDPDDPSQSVTSGSLLDEATGQVWSVVTVDHPVDEPGRTLALLLTAHLPCGRELAVLLEGYGLHLAGIGDTDDLVRSLGIVAPTAASGPARPAVALSFVRYLLNRASGEAFVNVLRTAQPGRLDASLREVYGRGLAALEQGWANTVQAGGSGVPTSSFLRLSFDVLKQHKRRQTEIFLYMLCSLAFTAAFPFVTQDLFDNAIPSGEMSEVLGALGVLAVAFVFSLAAGLRQAQLSAYVSGAVIRDLRQQMFDRLQQAPLAWFDRYQQGEVVSRLFSDVRIVEAGLSQTISQGVYQLLSLVVASVIMLAVEPLLAVMVLVGAPAVALVYRTMGSGSRQRSVVLQEEMASLLSVASENHAAQPVVKLFGLARHEQDRFASASGRVFRAERRLSLFGGLFGLSVNLIVTFLRLAVLGVGAWLVVEERLTLGGLVAFLSIMGEAINPVASLTSIGQDLQRATGALMRVNEILHAPREGDPIDGAAPSTMAVADPGTATEALRRPIPPLTGEIRFQGVSFSYDGRHRALAEVDCIIPAGAKVAFVGPSGSGKSTMLRLLMRLHDPDEGRLTIDGIDLRDGDLASLRSQIGVVFQDPFLFDATIRENILLGCPDADDAAFAAAVATAEVDDFVGALPRGYDTMVGERGGRLSGGQRQRVSIARAIIRAPRILVLDEATSALDPQTERQIVRTLDRVAEGRTTVSVTHRLASIAGYDRIYVVDGGRIVESGTHNDLLGAGGVYARLWREQHGGVHEGRSALTMSSVPRGTRVESAIGLRGGPGGPAPG